MKKKIALLLAFAAAGAFVCLGCVSVLSLLLTGSIHEISLPIMMQQYKLDRNAPILLLLIYGIYLLFLLYLFFVKDKRNGKNDLNRITPMVATPDTAGQQQHGSARWLKENEYHHALYHVTLDPNDTTIKILMEQGNSDLLFTRIGGDADA